MSNQTQRRPAVRLLGRLGSLLPTVEPPEAAGELPRWRTALAIRVIAAGVAEGQRGCATRGPKGVPSAFVLYRDTSERPTQQPALFPPIAVPKIFVTVLLAPDRPSEGGDGHELATWHYRLAIAGGNPGSWFFFDATVMTVLLADDVRP